MQGEHVVEMAHLFGLDMTVPHKASEVAELDVAVTITKPYDTHEGELVDVDYPAGPGVVLPEGARVFPTWDSRDFPRFVCAYRKTEPLGDGHCNYAGENRLDPLTGGSP